MKILSIGNSFSQDAQRYLHETAKQDGSDLKTVNFSVYPRQDAVLYIAFSFFRKKNIKIY